MDSWKRKAHFNKAASGGEGVSARGSWPWERWSEERVALSARLGLPPARVHCSVALVQMEARFLRLRPGLHRAVHPRGDSLAEEGSGWGTTPRIPYAFVIYTSSEELCFIAFNFRASNGLFLPKVHRSL